MDTYNSFYVKGRVIGGRSITTDREACYFCSLEIFPGQTIYLVKDSDRMVFDSEDCWKKYFSAPLWLEYNGSNILEERILV